MSFTTGFVAGAVVGGYLIYNMTPQQRERVAATADKAVQKVRNSSVVSSISNNVSEVAGAAGDRVADVVDSAGSAVADKVGPNGDTNGTTVEINV